MKIPCEGGIRLGQACISDATRFFIVWTAGPSVLVWRQFSACEKHVPKSLGFYREITEDEYVVRSVMES